MVERKKRTQKKPRKYNKTPSKKRKNTKKKYKRSNKKFQTGGNKKEPITNVQTNIHVLLSFPSIIYLPTSYIFKKGNIDHYMNMLELSELKEIIEKNDKYKRSPSIHYIFNNKPLVLIVCGSGGKVYDDPSDYSRMDENCDLCFVSDNLGFGSINALKNKCIISFFDENNTLEYQHEIVK